MELLVLGGTRFVGRALVDEALARGWAVTALHRGLTGTSPCPTLTVDRTDDVALSDALRGRHFDAVVDTWSGDPAVVQLAVDTLTDWGVTGRFGYVSSVSVYADGRPAGGDESWPTVEVAPGYAGDKRGGELASLSRFADALLARPGLVLGPHEDIGRLPWWLTRASAGGQLVAPGRPERPLQWVDARDLATWLLDGLASGLGGAVDLVCPSGHTTTRSLLEAVVETTGSRAELVWVPEADLAGVEPWTELPCWVPETPEFAGFMESDTSRAIATGLRSRPVAETVRDTWQWLQAEGPPVQRPDRAVHGLPPDKERALLGSTVEP